MLTKGDNVTSPGQVIADEAEPTGNINNSAEDVPPVSPNQVLIEEKARGEATFLVLETDYHNLYDISYHLHVCINPYIYVYRPPTKGFNINKAVTLRF